MPPLPEASADQGLYLFRNCGLALFPSLSLQIKRRIGDSDGAVLPPVNMSLWHCLLREEKEEDSVKIREFLTAMLEWPPPGCQMNLPGPLGDKVLNAR